MNYIAFLFTAASITGTLANSFQKKWCFWVWICTNSFWCIYNTLNKQYAQALLYAFNFTTCIIGLCKWKSKESILNKSLEQGKISINEYREAVGLPRLCKGLRTDFVIKDEYNEIHRFSPKTNKQYSYSAKMARHTMPQSLHTTFVFRLVSKWKFPKVWHLAHNAKRHRTRKKNIARLQREYRKFVKKGGGGV